MINWTIKGTLYKIKAIFEHSLQGKHIDIHAYKSKQFDTNKKQ